MTPLDSYTDSNSISTLSKSYIEDIGRWMRFAAIAYFIFLSFGTLAAIATLLASGSFAEELAPTGVSPSTLMIGSIAMLAFLAFLFYTAWIMLKAANGFRAYAATSDPTMLEQGFVNNKTYWLIMGVVSIIVLVFLIIGGFAMARFLPLIMSGALQ